MRPDKTNPCMADQTRKQQARSELIQTNQTKAYQDQSRTEQTDWAAPRRRGQTKLNVRFFQAAPNISNCLRLQRMIRPLGPNSQKQRPAVGESTWNREVDNPNHPSKNVSKPSKRRNLSNSKHVKNHDKLSTTPTQTHIQKDENDNAISPKTSRKHNTSTPNT